MLTEYEKALLRQMRYNLHGDKINIQPVVESYRKNDPQLVKKLHLMLEDFKVHDVYGTAWQVLSSARTYNDLVVFDMTPSAEEDCLIRQTMEVTDEIIAEAADQIMRKCAQEFDLQWKQEGPVVRCVEPRLTDILLHTKGNVEQIFIRLLAAEVERPDLPSLSLAELYNNDLQRIFYYTEAKDQVIWEHLNHKDTEGLFLS